MTKREGLSKSESSSEGACGQDITERERADRMLSESEQRLRSLVEETGVGVTIIDLTGEFTYVNGALAELLGYSVGELCGRRFEEFLHPDDIEDVTKLFLKAISSPIESETIEFRAMHKDGRVLHLMSKPTRYMIDDKTVGFQAIIIDITERKNAEEALRRSEERYRIINQNMSEGVFLMDMNLKPTYISPSVTRARGYTLDELYALPLDKQVTPDSLKLALETLQEALSEVNSKQTDRPLTRTLELEFYRKDGSTFWSENTLTLLVNSNGEPAGILAVSRDITERKRVENASRQQHSTLEGIINSSDAPIFSVDRQYRYTSFNNAHASAMKTIYGKDIEIGKSLFDYMTVAKDREEAKRNLDRALAGEHSVKEAYSGEEARSRLYFEVSHSPIMAKDGAVIGVAVFARDLTERRKMEQDLRASEARFRALTERSSDMILLTSPEGTILYLSPSVGNIMGYEPGKLVGRSVFELVHSDDSNRLMVGWRQLLREPEGSREAIVARVRHADGTWHIHEGTVRNLLHDPAVAAIVMNTRDITERKQTEEALRESEQKLKAVVYGSPIPQFVIDRNHTVIYWNNALQEITGIKAEQVVGTKEHWRAFYSEERPCMADLLIEGRTGQIPEWYRGKYSESTLVDDAYEATDYFPTMGKEGRWLYFTAAAIKDPDGNVIGAVETLEDITERRQAEEALQRSEEKYRSLVENINDTVFSVDVTGLLTYISPVAERTTGYKADELVGQPFSRFIHPDDLASVQQRFVGVLAGELEPLEYRILDKDGGVRFVRTSSRPLMEAGKLAGMTGVIIDITERRKMEAELEKYTKHLEELVDERTRKLRGSEEQTRAILNATTAILVVTDREGTVTDANRAFCEALGVSSESVVGRNVFELLAEPDALVRRRDLIEKVFRSGKPVRVEDRRHERWMDSVIYPVRGADGSVVAVAVSSLDITERKQMERELRSTRERLEYVVTSNPAVIYSGKPFADLSDWELTYLSENVAAILGHEAWEFVGHPEFWGRIVHPKDRPSVLAEIPRLWEKGRFTLEYRMRHKNGDYRWIREEANAVRDAEGKPVEVNGYWTDITAQKQAELALSESERKYRQLIESAQEGLFTYDKNAVVTFVNPFLSIMLGYAPEEMVGKNLLTFVDDQDLSKVKAGVERRRRGIADTYEVQLIRKDGSRIYTNATVSPITDENGKFAGGLALLSDVTELKHTQEALLKSQRLAAIGQTAAMVGHDLRNPLQAMTGALYLAKKLSRSKRVEQRKEAVELLDTIDDQILYMDKIVSDLQSYAGPVGAEPVETNLPNLVREVISNAHVPENVETHVEVQEDLTRVMVDRTLLQRVLANLIANAVQAMPKGGNVTVTAHKEKESVTITVEDTGEGIARENMDKIFTPFFTTKAKGQGLGLSVCKRLVEAQDGTITATSEVGKGSTFILKIPTSSVSGAV